jgi:hypothetical protein
MWLKFSKNDFFKLLSHILNCFYGLGMHEGNLKPFSSLGESAPLHQKTQQRYVLQMQVVQWTVILTLPFWWKFANISTA